MIRMQEGMRIKSKDIHFEISIFYLAKNKFIGIFINNLIENYFLIDWFIYIL